MKTICLLLPKHSTSVGFALFFLFNCNILFAQSVKSGRGLILGAQLTSTLDLKLTTTPNEYMGTTLHHPTNLRKVAGARAGYFTLYRLSENLSLGIAVQADYSTMRFDYQKTETLPNGLIYRASEGVVRHDEVVVSAPLGLYRFFSKNAYLFGTIQLNYTLYNGSKWNFSEFNYADPRTSDLIVPLIEQRVEEMVEFDTFNWSPSIGFGHVLFGSRGVIEVAYSINGNKHTSIIEPAFRKMFLSVVFKRYL